MKIMAHVLAAMPDAIWEPGFVRGYSNRRLWWAPILQIGKLHYREGFTKAGDWVAECSDGLAIIEQSHNAYCALLPILERSPLEIKNALSASIKRLPYSESIIEAFPFSGTIQFGLSMGDYWADLALSWIETFDHFERQQYADALRLILLDADRVSQGTRRRVQYILSEIPR